MYHYNLGMLFENSVASRPSVPALRYPEEILTHGQMLVLAQKLAALLLAEGCVQGQVIAIAHNKRPLSYALMLAALRLGIPYVTLDAASPVARTLRIMQTSGARLLFYDDPAYAQPMQALADQAGRPLRLLDVAALPELSTAALEEQARLMRRVDGACLAYIMFTSGSTGTPKGVAVTHQNILHFIQWGTSCFGIEQEDIFANVSPMYFDNSVFDFYVGLFSGASLAPVPRQLLTAPYELVPYVASMGCTIWFSVPSLLIYLMAMKALSPTALPALRSISFGGEGYPKVELKKLYQMFSPQARIVNVYGPTECTCICSAYELGSQDFEDLEGLPTLGCLNQNFDYYIEDEAGHKGLSGELCLVGPNVSAGYFNDPERTEAAFFTLTEPERYMKRMYRTGDLVREEGGKLYFMGRKDNQIKHMGYRIELEEIEHALIRLPGVSQAAVVYERQSAAYGKIMAYVACPDGGDEQSLRHGLAELVPDYMLPSRLTLLPELPKNANGKVDRQTLKAGLAGPR